VKGLSIEEEQKIVTKNTILLGYVGSIAHGTYQPSTKPDSIDDKDIMGICIGNPETYLGFDRFEQKIVKYKEWDSVIYEIKKMFHLLLKCNPNVMSLLWLSDNYYIIKEEAGERIIENRRFFVSKKAYYSFTGYAYSQLKRMGTSESGVFLNKTLTRIEDEIRRRCLQV